jgi:hypothetical protein
LRVDHARWGQTPTDLRRLSMSASHPRTRERFLALYEITQESCATELRHARCRADAPSPPDGAGVAASLQHPRGADLSAAAAPPHMMVWTVKQVNSSAHPVRLAIITWYGLSKGRPLKVVWCAQPSLLEPCCLNIPSTPLCYRSRQDGSQQAPAPAGRSGMGRAHLDA